MEHIFFTMSQMIKPYKNRAFTLIELLVVIAIIGILSSVVLASLSGARKSARDARRKQDLRQIQTALEMYHNNNQTYEIEGYGYNGNANGWFNADAGSGSSYPAAVAQGLVDAGVVGQIIIDPTGVIRSDDGQSGYMIITNDNHYTLWANLENPSSEDVATQDSCYHDNYDNYNGNINYCVSN